MHNQFYFLHLDKTIAKTAGIRLFDPMYPIMEENGVAATELNMDHAKHNKWRDFDEKTFIFSILRNPVSRTLSEFSWWANYGDDNKRTHHYGRDSECPAYTKETLMDWLYNKHIPNYQSRTIEGNINRINMLVRAEDIRGNENTLRDTMMKSLGITHNFKHYPLDFENVFMQTENKMNDIVNENLSILDDIKELNYEDYKLYTQASYASILR